MAFRRSPILRVLIAVTVLALPLTAFAGEEVGKTGGGGASIEWQLKVTGHDRVELNVLAPNGNNYSRTFANGKSPNFRVLDLGTDLEDGVYNYELRVIPVFPASLKAQLAKARNAGDDAGARKLLRESGISAPVQSGAFTIRNGMIVAPGATESEANAQAAPRSISTSAVVPGRGISVEDQVIPDDLIVQGSTCTGLDCVNNENFGFDTLRLKENNLRIHFDDTSSSAGFPANDWRFIANGSNSGDASFLAIEDSTAGRNIFVAEAGAPSNSLVVDSTGRIGIQQAAPVLDVHVTTGNTPAVRLEQTSASGFTAQTWDIGANEANFFVRDITGGSKLSFRIRPGAPTSSIDISASGNVGIGTASPQRLLHLTSSSGNAAIQFTTNLAKSWHIANSTNDLNFSETSVADARLFLKAGGNVGIACNNPAAKFVVASGSGCSTPTSSLNPGDAQFTVASSRTFKENIAPVTVPDVLDRIEKVGVYNYDYIDGPKDRLGMIAEDFHEVFGRGDEKYINGGDVQVALWLAVQQLTAQNKALSERIDALDKELAASQPQN